MMTDTDAHDVYATYDSNALLNMQCRHLTGTKPAKRFSFLLRAVVTISLEAFMTLLSAVRVNLSRQYY